MTPWTASCSAPPSMEFSRQEYWSGLPFPSPGDLPNPGIEPGSSSLQADSLLSEPPGKPRDGSHSPKLSCSEKADFKLNLEEWDQNIQAKIRRTAFQIRKHRIT